MLDCTSFITGQRRRLGHINRFYVEGLHPKRTQSALYLGSSRIIMAKRVQLVLSQDISKLGKTGDLVEVAPGYARNYLLPRGLGYRATPGVLKQVERRREEERQRLEQIKQDAEAMKTAIATIGLFTIKKEVGENEAIFGTVTADEVAELIKTNTGKDIDKRDIDVPPINKLGEYTVLVKLHSEVTAELRLRVA